MNLMLVARVDPIELFVSLALLGGAVLLLAAVVALVKMWYAGSSKPSDAAASEGLMSQIERMKAEGEISEEEYDKIKEKMKAKLRSKIDSADPTPDEPTPEDRPEPDSDRDRP